jgi:serine O-acetyltransferase
MQLRIYLIANTLHRLKLTPFAKLLTMTMRIITGAYVPAAARIGRGTKFAYGAAGLVLHERVAIGNNCLLSPGVVVGGRGGHYDVPRIEDDVKLYPGSMVLGPITIGRGSVIGANAVVVSDLSPGSVVVAPASRVLPRDVEQN